MKTHTLSQLQRDLATHATEKSKQAITDVAFLAPTPVDQMIILHTVTISLFKASMVAALSTMPIDERSRALNDQFKILYRQIFDELKNDH